MRKTIGIGIGIGATALAALALGGVTVAAAAGAADDRRPVVASAGQTASRVDVTEARRLAEAAVPGGRVVEIESDDLADRPVWKATVDSNAGRVTVFVDAMTGAVTVGNRRDDPSPTRSSTGPDDSATRGADDRGRGGADDSATRGADDRGRRGGTDDRPSAGEDRHGGGGHGSDDPPAHR